MFKPTFKLEHNWKKITMLRIGLKEMTVFLNIQNLQSYKLFLPASESLTSYMRILPSSHALANMLGLVGSELNPYTASSWENTSFVSPLKQKIHNCHM